MRKTIIILMVLIMLFGMSGYGYAQDIRVVIDNNEIEFEVDPVVVNGRVMVPFRQIFEVLGLEVEWNENLRIATAHGPDTSLAIKVDSIYGNVNGELIELDAPSMIVEDRMMVPLRFISEAFGNEVLWDGDARLVTIDTAVKVDSTALDFPTVGNYEKLVAILEYAQRFSFDNPFYYDDVLFEPDFEIEMTADEIRMEGEVSESADMTAPSEAKGAEYSSTNVQVEGVDESDIVKTDGEYIYHLRGNVVSIVEVNDADLKLISEIVLNHDYMSDEMYLNNDQLIVMGSSYEPIYIQETTVDYEDRWYRPAYTTRIDIYDISDRKKPDAIRHIEIDGSYLTSRLIEDSLYIVANKNIYFYNYYDESGLMPTVYDSSMDELIKVPYDEIKYFPDSVDSNYLITVGVDLSKPDEEIDINACLGSGENVYVSRGHMYVAVTKYDFDYESTKKRDTEYYYPTYDINTEIYKFGLDEGKVSYTDKGKVPGIILNQFSMDEYEDNFRIATTTGDIWRTDENISKNNVYVLDENMNRIGTLEGIAPGEKIYSVRFMGERAYMVTFRQVDPFFVIDLSDATKPTILGYLKIPGYSDYLHPYDKDHIIGFGMDTEEVKNGVVISGMKIALFDVTDVENPTELDKVEIGDRGTYSELLNNHKALMFSQSNSLMAFPVTVMEESADGGTRFVFQGAYVYMVTPENGFVLKGKATHLTNEDYEKAGMYWYDSDKNIRRIIYIGDYLYTLSDSQVQSHDNEDVSVEDELMYEE